MDKNNKTLDSILDVLFGVSVGDAIGVPVEFKSRSEIIRNPVTDIRGYGSYNQPPGTFSDDSSLTFCLSEALASGFDLNKIAKNFINWRYSNFWTARGKVFDIGITTQRAIDRLVNGVQPDLAGDFEESSNGNGALMRILPLLFYIENRPIGERFKIIRQVTSITHGHIRSTIACFYYLEFALGLLQGENKYKIYEKLQYSISNHLDLISINSDEKNIFIRLLADQIDLIPEEKIFSSGYVVHTLEASIWCLLLTDNYKDAVLKAVNLGSDTDTTAAVTGGLAGLLYGCKTIPKNWINQLARKQDIEDLGARFFTRYQEENF